MSVSNFSKNKVKPQPQTARPELTRLIHIIEKRDTLIRTTSQMGLLVEFYTGSFHEPFTYVVIDKL